MYGDHIDAQSQKDTRLASSMGRTTDVDGEDDGCIDKLFMSISSGKRKFAAEEHPGHHRIKSEVDRLAQYVRDVYIDWEDNMAAITLGVVLMSTYRGGGGAQEKVHFPSLALGGIPLRPHRGQTCLYEDGAFRLFDGVGPEYMIARCKEYADRFE